MQEAEGREQQITRGGEKNNLHEDPHDEDQGNANGNGNKNNNNHLDGNFEVTNPTAPKAPAALPDLGHKK